MKRKFFAAGLFTVLASTYSYGQNVPQPIAQATVPFRFQMGWASMPAGTYVISSESGGLVLFRGLAGKPAAAILTLPASRHGKSLNSSLQFTRYGDDYFLAKIRTEDLPDGLAFPKSKREKELARSAAFSHTDEIALQTHNRSVRDTR